MESRDSRREVCKQINWIDFCLECLRNRKNISIYTSFGRNRLIEMIDGYDEKVHHGPFRLYRSRRIVMEGPDETDETRYKMHSIVPLESRSDGPDASRAIRSQQL